MTRRAALFALGATVGVVLGPLATPAPAGAAAHGTGTVTVLYAGSLTDLIEHTLGPAFEATTGYTFTGMSGGSDALASDIKGDLVRADVFVSASPKVDTTLEGKANGDWLSWDAAFGTTPLVLGYNPASRFAKTLRSEPWWKVVDRPGFLLGRTDPATDPKGALAVEAVHATATKEHDTALDGVLSGTSTVFPEQTLVGRLQAGQLDAGFFYAAEAKAAGIPTVALKGTDLSATYTVATVRTAPDPTGAKTFAAFLVGPDGRRLLKAAGVTALVPTRFTGSKVPSSVEAAARR